MNLDERLLSPAYIESPYDTYDLLRAHALVYWSARWSAWIVTRYDDVLAILRGHRRFSNRAATSTTSASCPSNSGAS